MLIDTIIKNNNVEELTKLGYKEAKSALSSLKQINRDHPTLIESIASKSLNSPDPDICITNFCNLIESIGKPAAVNKVIEVEANLSQIITLSGASPFLINFLGRYEGFFEEFFNNNYSSASKDSSSLFDELKKQMSGAENLTEEEILDIFRIFRNKEYLRIGLRDLNFLAPVEETTRELSDLASASLQVAYEYAYKELTFKYGEPFYADHDGQIKKAEFVVIGMGKLGGRELNFSSDIDIIFIYSSSDGETEGIKDSDGNLLDKSKLNLHSFFVKLSEKITYLINNITSEGFVFRVDLELRPDGFSGPVAASLAGAERYYEGFGQSWERGAMIKARPVAGSGNFGDSLGREFLEMITPFVYRKYLDFGSVEEIKLMKEKIDVELARQQSRNRPDSINVKLGKGGIREIEFFCQALQLIHGGKNKDVRTASTLTAIKKLETKNLINKDEASCLTNNYIFLRNLEHRIQITDGRQTQTIPATSKTLTALAKMMNIEARGDEDLSKTLLKKYAEITDKNYSIYETLFYSSEKLTEELNTDIVALLSNTLDEDSSMEVLVKLGFQNPKTSLEKINLFSSNNAFRYLPQKAKTLLEKLKPSLLETISKASDPDRALTHSLGFLLALGGRASHYSMLIENPQLVELLIKVFSSSDFLAQTLIETPGGLDILLSSDVTRIKKTKEEILENLNLKDLNYEDCLKQIRRQKDIETFRIGINNISGDLTNVEVSTQFTYLAEATLEASIKIATKELAKTYGEPSDASSLSIIGLGKLGGREIIYGSDLDIIFVYNNKNDAATETTGPKKISKQEYFVKLAQRIISVLSLKTSEGTAFEIDTELRPSGNAGTLVINSTALVEYYKNKALGWEKQAFTKARLVAGANPSTIEMIKEIKNHIYKNSITKEELQEQLKVRKKMEIELAKETKDKINIKTGVGGLVDIEFLAQTLQIKEAFKNPSLISTETLETLSKLESASIITSDELETLTKAYNLYRDIEIKLRIIHNKSSAVIDKTSPETKTLIKKLAITKTSDEFYNKLDNLSNKVRELYLKKTTPL